MPENPFRAADLPSGRTSEAFDALPTSALVEHLNHLDHRIASHPHAYGRWWLSKQLAEGQRALVRRGLKATAWMPAGGAR